MISNIKKWNARSVIERACIICEPLRYRGCPRFWLNPAQAAEFENILVPEFQFTQSNFREILQGVGKFIHGEPRLRGHEIYYDMYGSDEQNPNAIERYAALELTQDISRYATNIDSNVGNLVNSIDYAKGVVIEPFNGGTLSMRCESVALRVEEGNMFFQTKYGINEVVKFEFYYDNSYVDITKYVFEEADYIQLSTFDRLYKYSKAAALYYNRGAKGIYGFNVKEQYPIFPDWVHYSIVNILASKLRQPVGSVENWIKAHGGYPGMRFKITYKAFTPARVQQNKSIITGLNKHFTSSYNQGQNVVESSYFGENLKGVVARLGNVDKVMTFVGYGLVKPPKIGTLYSDDYYVSSVATEITPYTTKITAGLTKDFNRYSEYVSLDRQKRQYEISEKAAYNSFFSYRDYCIVGRRFYNSDNIENFLQYGEDPLIALDRLAPFLFGIMWANIDKPVSLVEIYGKDNNGNSLQKVVLPVQAVSAGNAAVLIASFEDNYSAGNNALFRENGDVNGYFTAGVNYTNYYGDIEQLIFNFRSGASPNGSMLDTAQSLPAANNVDFGSNVNILAGTHSAGIWVKKGSTETLSLSYQMDFVANDPSIIIGSGFAEYCGLLQGPIPIEVGEGLRLFLLKKKLNKFDKMIDDSAGNATPVTYNGSLVAASGILSIRDYEARFNPGISVGSGPYEAWAIGVSEENNTGYHLIVGQNKHIEPGESIFGDNLYITLVHDYADKPYTQRDQFNVTLIPTNYKINAPIMHNGVQLDNSVWVAPFDGYETYQDAKGKWYIRGTTLKNAPVTISIIYYTWRTR